jgi:acyl transferase domain-containing protein
MNLPDAKNFARIVYHKTRFKLDRLKRSFFTPNNPPILSVYGGRSHYWNGMGKELYKNEPVFKQTILRCDEYIKVLLQIPFLTMNIN